MSSYDDLFSGGADSVFTRIISLDGLKNYDDDYPITDNPPFTLVMRHSVMDRTDWYAYNDDNYGSTDAEVFNVERQSPLEVFEAQRNDFSFSNEQMFKRGIAMSDIKCLAVIDEDSRQKTIQDLVEAGVTHINGRPVEEFVVLIKGISDLIDVAYDREPSALSAKEERSKNGALKLEFVPYTLGYRVVYGRDLLNGEQGLRILINDYDQTKEMFDRMTAYQSTLHQESLTPDVLRLEMSKFIFSLVDTYHLTLES